MKKKVATLIYKAQQFMLTLSFSKKSVHILEDNASGVQVVDTKN
jgi:hypothetical protein